MLIGIHTSIKNGYAGAVVEGEECGAEAIQIFVRQNLTYNQKDISNEEIQEFKNALNKSKLIRRVIAHSSYLINLASDNITVVRRSISLMAQELKLCSLLGIDIYVMHPGSHKGRGVKIGIDKIVDGLAKVIELVKDDSVRVTFETTAGSGNQIGSRLEEISELIDGAKKYVKTGLCIDTAHLFGSGYNIADEDEYNNIINNIDEHIGLENLLVCHINDSKAKLGSKKDRHEHIGEGMIHLSAFKRILKDNRLKNSLAILETPKGIREEDGVNYDLINVELLKRLRDE